jgi:hypothetical protein
MWPPARRATTWGRRPYCIRVPKAYCYNFLRQNEGMDLGIEVGGRIAVSDMPSLEHAVSRLFEDWIVLLLVKMAPIHADATEIVLDVNRDRMYARG